MPKMSLVITGDKELNRKLERLSSKEAKKVVRKAARKALKPVLQQARGNAPVKSGFLRKNIKIRSLPRSRVSFGSRVTSGLPGKKLNTGDAYYGAFLELGTKRMKRRPFMKPAAETKKAQALNIYKAQIRTQLIQLAQRG